MTIRELSKRCLAVTALVAIVAVAPTSSSNAEITTIYGNSATSGPDLVHQIDKATGALIQNFNVSSGNGRGVVVVNNVIYSTESGPAGNVFGGSNQIYMTDLTTGLPLGSITVIGLPSGAAMSTLAWDGTAFWTSEYLGGNHAYRIDTSGNIIKTIVLSLASSNMDGLEFFNDKLICNRGDTIGPYDVYDLDGNVLTPGFIDPSTIGVTATTGIAFDGTDFYTSDIHASQLEIWDGTTGAHKGSLPLTGGSFLIEDLSFDYGQRPDTAELLCANGIDDDHDGLVDCADPDCADDPACLIPPCGNGVLDPGEECDDGNVIDGDGCSSQCQLEPRCGDGTLDPGEECDDGNTVSGDGSMRQTKREDRDLPRAVGESRQPSVAVHRCECGARASRQPRRRLLWTLRS
jgi:cysteine-rich repeat protein